MKNNLFKIPFNAELLFNYGTCNYKEKPEWMSENDYKCNQIEYHEEEAKVLFKNVKVEYESCDCGNGYGCSHADYPYGLIFDNQPNESYFEDDGILICNDKGMVRFDNLKDISMGHFVNACELLDIKLEFTETGNKILNDKN